MEHLASLKNEQTARIVLRDTALYVFLGIIFAVYAAEGQAGSNHKLIELIRTCSTGLSAIMLSIYLSNDHYVSEIGRFVCSEPRADAFKRWEHSHRKGWRHHVQKFFRTLIVVLLFGGWAVYQTIQVFASGSIPARVAAALFDIIVIVQLSVFLFIAFAPAPGRGDAAENAKDGNVMLG